MKFSNPKVIDDLKPETKQYYVRESDGFAIRVLPSGIKTWLFIYTRYGKRRQINLGEYPAISIKTARSRLIDVRKAFNDGLDPQEVGFQWHHNPDRDREEAKRAEDENAKNPTVNQLAELYLRKHAKMKKRESSWKEDERLLNKDILPLWGARKARDITRRDIKGLLETVVKRGPALAANIKKLLSKMFSFAVDDEEILDVNPCHKIALPAPVLKRERSLNAEEVRKLLLTELPKASISSEVKHILILILRTGQRPGEIAGMHRREIEGSWWTIPGARTKNGRTHRVYLTEKVLEIIGTSDGYIFPAPRSNGKSHIGENALAYAVRRNIKDYQPRRPIKGESIRMVKVREDRKMEIAHFTPHDLRRTATTLMAAAKVPLEHRERVTNHSQGKLDGIYNLHDYDDEKREAMIKLEQKIARIIGDNHDWLVVAEPPTTY